MTRLSFILGTAIMLCACVKHTDTVETASTLDSTYIDSAMVDFVPYPDNPVFKGTGTDTWDEAIRERGFILQEEGTYHMWYTGYRNKEGESLHLGYATSPDGFKWTRHDKNPLIDTGWQEDMMVVKKDGTYYMFAEGMDDIAHLLTSTDKIHWKEEGDLDIRYVNGQPLSKGPYGTPAAWFEDNLWYLLYERGDLGVWLATSKDLKVWTNVQDEPVLIPGPELYDAFGIAVNQVIKHKGKYYAYYHATAFKDWSEWSSCVATSFDLRHWTKYAGNPILTENKSSPILAFDGTLYRLYSMHPQVVAHYPASSQP